jgi:hypothetical protein
LQDTELNAEYFEAPPAPESPAWEIGCAYSASGNNGDDISVSGELMWHAPGVDGVEYFNATGLNYVSGRFTRFVDATLEDMTVTCTATYSFSSLSQIITRQSSQQIQGRVPIDLRRSWENWTYTAPGDYLLDVKWQVYDWSGPWAYYNMPVSENFDFHQNGCNITLFTATGYTQPGGWFPDKYGNWDGNSRIANCPTSCATTTTQNIDVAGYAFSHGVDWGCYGVIVGRD